MRFVKVEQTRDGYSLDPTAYLEFLGEHAGSLPSGAAAYARDPQHYDFYGTSCVKDLKLNSIKLMDEHGALSAELIFSSNKFKHDSGLVIRYIDLIKIAVDVSPGSIAEKKWPETRRLGDVQLDEVLPHEAGCSHEIRMTGGIIFVVSSDLVAEWKEV
jgi:hypothetical protein